MRLALVLILFVTQVNAVERVDWKSDGYQVALWKLYHQFKPLVGRTWEQTKEARRAEGLVEDDLDESQYLETHVCVMQGKSFREVRRTHKVQVSFLVDTRSGLLIAAKPSLRLDFPAPISLSAARQVFDDKSVAARVLALDSVKAAVSHDPRIEMIQVTFEEVRNRWLEYGCNGFSVAIYCSPKAGALGALRYFTASGLDPFVNREGRLRNRAWKSADVLIDPEYGLPCEVERSGARALVKD